MACPLSLQATLVFKILMVLTTAGFFVISAFPHFATCKRTPQRKKIKSIFASEKKKKLHSPRPPPLTYRSIMCMLTSFPGDSLSQGLLPMGLLLEERIERPKLMGDPGPSYFLNLEKYIYLVKKRSV